MANGDLLISRLQWLNEKQMARREHANVDTVYRTLNRNEEVQKERAFATHETSFTGQQRAYNDTLKKDQAKHKAAMF